MKKTSEPHIDLEKIKVDEATTLGSLSEEKPVMLIFLRHFGCIFCQEALRDISAQKKEIEDRGNALVFVHMEDDDVAKPYFAKYGLAGCLHIADPECDLYRQFGLIKGSFSQLFGLSTMARGFQVGMTFKQFGGAPFGDAFQMPGIFIIQNNEIAAKFIHQKISDRPNYLELLECCVIK